LHGDLVLAARAGELIFGKKGGPNFEGESGVRKGLDRQRLQK
jgi:hypothetical protein